jgi:hypothetical protein
MQFLYFHFYFGQVSSLFSIVNASVRSGSDVLGGCDRRAESVTGREVALTVTDRYCARTPAGFWAASTTIGSYRLAFSRDFDCVVFVGSNTDHRLYVLLCRIRLAQHLAHCVDKANPKDSSSGPIEDFAAFPYLQPSHSQVFGRYGVHQSFAFRSG